LDFPKGHWGYPRGETSEKREIGSSNASALDVPIRRPTPDPPQKNKVGAVEIGCNRLPGVGNQQAKKVCRSGL